MKRALITGILGQDGFYLADYLLKKGYDVFGTVRRNPPDGSPIASLLSCHNFLYADMTNENQLYEAVIKSEPDEIYNLAGQTFPPSSWHYSWKCFDVNAGGFARIMEIVQARNKGIKVFQPSTADMFGVVEGRCDENTKMNPGTPYGVSKLAAHQIAALYRKKGFYVSTCILFNHDSALRGTGFVTSKIANHLRNHGIQSDHPEVLKLGYLDGRRDWGFAGDYVKAMHASLQAPVPDDYVIGTGENHSVREFLSEALSVESVNKEWFYKNYLVSDESLRRPNESMAMSADWGKAHRVLGWRPETSFKEMVSLMMRGELYATGNVAASA